MAVADKEWWNENLPRSAILCLTRIKVAATAVEYGTAQLALDQVPSTSPNAPLQPGVKVHFSP